MAAAAHYDNTGSAVAVVRAGEDQHGIWLRGKILPGTDDARIDELKRSSVSGDWRDIRHDGRLELVAALACNVPGFPIPRTETLVAGGQPVGLVAAGMVRRKAPDEPILYGEVEQLVAAAVSDATARVERRNSIRARFADEQAAVVAGRRARAQALTAAAAPAIAEARLSGARSRMAALLAAGVPKTDDQKAKPLENYWTRGKGLARWATTGTPYRSLVAALKTEIPAGEMTDDQVHGLAAKYYHKVFHKWPGNHGSKAEAVTAAGHGLFDESKHRRDGHGKFTFKGGKLASELSTPEVRSERTKLKRKVRTQGAEGDDEAKIAELDNELGGRGDRFDDVLPKAGSPEHMKNRESARARRSGEGQRSSKGADDGPDFDGKKASDLDDAEIDRRHAALSKIMGYQSVSDADKAKAKGKLDALSAEKAKRGAGKGPAKAEAEKPAERVDRHSQSVSPGGGDRRRDIGVEKKASDVKVGDTWAGTGKKITKITEEDHPTLGKQKLFHVEGESMPKRAGERETLHVGRGNDQAPPSFGDAGGDADTVPALAVNDPERQAPVTDLPNPPRREPEAPDGPLATDEQLAAMRAKLAGNPDGDTPDGANPSDAVDEPDPEAEAAFPDPQDADLQAPEDWSPDWSPDGGGVLVNELGGDRGDDNDGGSVAGDDVDVFVPPEFAGRMKAAQKNLDSVATRSGEVFATPGVSDEDVEKALADLDAAQARVDSVQRAIDRDQRSRQRDQDFEAEAARLVEENGGGDPEEIEAQLRGITVEKLRNAKFVRWAKDNGYTGRNFEERVRSFHAEHAAKWYEEAEDATRGQMVKRKYENQFDPAQFWTVTDNEARKYMSDEMAAWFDDRGGRITKRDMMDAILAGRDPLQARSVGRIKNGDYLR